MKMKVRNLIVGFFLGYCLSSVHVTTEAKQQMN